MENRQGHPDTRRSLVPMASAIAIVMMTTVGSSASAAAAKCDASGRSALARTLGTVVASAGNLTGLSHEMSAWKFAFDYGKFAYALSGVLDTTPTTAELFAGLESDLYKIGSISFNAETAIVRNTHLAYALSAVDQAERAAWAGKRLDEFGPADLESATAVKVAYASDALSRRLVDPCANTGPVNWQSFVKGPEVSGGTVYEWRFTVPYLMNVIGLRLLVLTSIHPEWRSDGYARSEIDKHAKGLRGHLDRMVGGIRCAHRIGDGNVHGGPFGGSPPDNLTVVCADVHSGLAARWTERHAPSAERIRIIEETLYYQVFSQLPLFDMRALSDTLNLYVSRTADLAEVRQRIRPSAASNLCLEVEGGSSKAGVPVRLGTCNGSTAQKWSYDRLRREIRNPALNTCLDVRRYLGHAHLTVPGPGTPVLSSPCDGSQYQQWTYDPDTRVLTNAFGTVLDIRWADLRAGTPVWIWGRNGGPAQRWSADQPVSFVPGPRPVVF